MPVCLSYKGEEERVVTYNVERSAIAGVRPALGVDILFRCALLCQQLNGCWLLGKKFSYDYGMSKRPNSLTVL